MIELNEAFAAQSLAVIKDLDLDREKVNPNGGAIALGHPIAATGAVITAKILYEMERHDHDLGLVTLCIGGGQGIAMLLEPGLAEELLTAVNASRRPSRDQLRYVEFGFRPGSRDRCSGRCRPALSRIRFRRSR